MADTVGALVCLTPASTRCRRARHAAWGGSPVGGHGDVFTGGSPWTVTGPLFDSSSFMFLISLSHFDVHVTTEFATVQLLSGWSLDIEFRTS